MDIMERISRFIGSAGGYTLKMEHGTVDITGVTKAFHSICA